jgi:thiol peroxidase
MKTKSLALPITLAAITSTLTACFSKDEFAVVTGTAAPASHIDWLGNQTKLLGDGELAVGKPLPVTTVVNEKMTAEPLGGAGKVRLISVVPSLDTEVCDRQTHILSETKTLGQDVERITISRDLPYAQRRFVEKSSLTNLKILSDYRGGEFGKRTGLVIERNNLLARAVIVLDKEGIVRHLQITPVIYALPDMKKAIEKANELSR